jgi:hypothetical protein
MNRPASVSVCACAVLLVSPAVRADITMEEHLSTQGAGVMSMANMQGKSVTTISGNRSRRESEIQMQSKLVNMFNRGGPTAEIVRLDEDKVYELQLKKKTYTETSLAEQRERLQKTLEQQQQAQAQQQQSGSGVDESKCEWLPPKVDVKRTGEKGTFAGFQAERVVVSAVQSCKVKDTPQVCDFAMSFDQWLAADFDGDREALAYQRAYAEKLGIPAAGSRDFAERAEALFGRYKDLWRDLGAKLKDLKGYPVKSSVGFAVGGAQCQSRGGADSEGSSARPGAGGIAGALGGFLNRKKEKSAEAQPAASAPATLPNGLVPLMTVTSELVSVSHAAASPQTFEVPADYKKVDKN